MHLRGFLSRLHRPETGRSSSHAEAIRGHLLALLNERQVSPLGAPKGCGCVVFDIMHDIPRALAHLSHQIKNTILRNEPRLQGVVVHSQHDPDAAQVKVQIRGRLVQDPHQTLCIEVGLSPQGRFFLL